MRALYENIGRPGTFIVSATRLGGHHGYDALAQSPHSAVLLPVSPKPTSGSVPDSLAKAVDFEPNAQRG